jgi:hypothetical protein
MKIYQTAFVRDQDAFVRNTRFVDRANNLVGLRRQGITMISMGFSISPAGELMTGNRRSSTP